MPTTVDSQRRPRWIYIVGQQRSGSTLLGLLLSRGLDGFFCGELRSLWEVIDEDLVCDCGEAVRDCDVWSAVAGEVYRQLGVGSASEVRELEGPALRHRQLIGARLPTPDPRQVHVRRATEQAVERVTGETTLIDSSKLPATLLVASHVDRPLCAVHLVRDPRAVAFSQSRPKANPGRHGELMPRASVGVSSFEWVWSQVLTERIVRNALRRSALVDVVRLRYEDVVGDPIAALAPLVTAPPADLAVAPGAHRLRHAVVGNPVRFDPRPVVPDDRWAREMGRAPRLVSTVLTGPLMQYYGYRWRGSRGRAA